MSVKHAFLTIATQAAFVAAEGVAARALQEKVMRVTPQGDGHGVLIDTGFLSGAHHVKSLVGTLLKKNFNVVVMPGVCNTSFGTDEVVEARIRAIDKLYDKSGPVSLSGESAGGLNLLLAAYERREKVSNITLFGTPVNFTSPTLMSGGLRKIFKMINPRQDLEDMELARKIMTPLAGVPRTSISPSHDVLVNPDATIGYSGPLTENISVIGTHFGINNPLVQAMKIDRFMQQPDDWKPFDTERYNRLLFPVYMPQQAKPRL